MPFPKWPTSRNGFISAHVCVIARVRGWRHPNWWRWKHVNVTSSDAGRGWLYLPGLVPGVGVVIGLLSGYESTWESIGESGLVQIVRVELQMTLEDPLRMRLKPMGQRQCEEVTSLSFFCYAKS